MLSHSTGSRQGVRRVCGCAGVICIRACVHACVHVHVRRREIGVLQREKEADREELEKRGEKETSGKRRGSSVKERLAFCRGVSRRMHCTRAFRVRSPHSPHVAELLWGKEVPLGSAKSAAGSNMFKDCVCCCLRGEQQRTMLNRRASKRAVVLWLSH